MRSVLNSREARLLIRYLDGVDALIGRRIAPSHRLDEDSLTAALCEMLDEELSGLHALPFSYDALQAELAEDPRELTARINIESTTYSKQVERQRTSADIGVVVSFRNWLDGSAWERGALLQAKRIYPSNSSGEFDLHSEFRAFDWEQFLRLATLLPPHAELQPGRLSNGNLPTSGFCAYLFYLPRPEAFARPTAQAIHNWMAINAQRWDHWHMHELLGGGALHALEVASDPKRYVPSLVTAHLDWLICEHLVVTGKGIELAPGRRVKPTVENVWQRYFHYRGSLSLSWRLVYDMMNDHFGSSDPAVLDLVRGTTTSAALAPFLPKYVLNLAIEAGSSPDRRTQ